MSSALRTTCFLALLASAALGCDGPAPSDPDGGSCTPGSAGCACREGELCDGDLVCDTGLCRGVDRHEIEIVDADARSCEVVLVANGIEIVGVEFSDGVVGTSISEPPRTALTFFRQDDSSFGRGAVTALTSRGMGRITARRARCFDRHGAELSGAALRVGG